MSSRGTAVCRKHNCFNNNNSSVEKVTNTSGIQKYTKINSLKLPSFLNGFEVCQKLKIRQKLPNILPEEKIFQKVPEAMIPNLPDHLLSRSKHTYQIVTLPEYSTLLSSPFQKQHLCSNDRDPNLPHCSMINSCTPSLSQYHRIAAIKSHHRRSSHRISFNWFLFLCLALLNTLNIQFSECTRQSLRYNYPHDEVNFSLSQEEYGQLSTEDETVMPEFVGQVPNTTVQIGRDARLPCIVQNLGTYRAAWIRDEEKNILTLQRQMVTRDSRISLQEESQIDIGSGDGDFRDNNQRIRYFVLIIRNVQVSDRGGYMCQINTVPMKSQLGYLRVVVPPDIIDEESSGDVTVVEGVNVTLKCKARGFPQPEIEWRREDGNRVPLGERNGNRRLMTNKTEGELLEMVRVTRVHSGAWLCIASNGVMPSVSRRILLNVQFSPQIWIPIEEIGAPLGSNITLDCHIEAYPLPLNYWTFGSLAESIYISGPKYEVSVKEKGYKRHLRLTIQKLEESDLGTYRCHAQNSLGRLEKQVLIYASDTRQQIQSKPSIKPLSNSKTVNNKKRKKKKKQQLRKSKTMSSSESTSSLSTPTSGGDNLLYNVFNSFGKPTQQTTQSATNHNGHQGTNGNTLVNDQQPTINKQTGNKGTNDPDDEIDGDELEDEYESYDGANEEGDYSQFGANLATSVPASSFVLLSLSLLAAL